MHGGVRGAKPVTVSLYSILGNIFAQSLHKNAKTHVNI